MYDSSNGRWMQLDPKLFEAGDSNLYRYVGNNPTNTTDPSGLQALDQTGPALSLTTLGSVRTGQYGAFWWPITWRLHRNADARLGGFVIQHIKTLDFKIDYYQEVPVQLGPPQRIVVKSVQSRVPVKDMPPSDGVTKPTSRMELQLKGLLDPNRGTIEYWEAWRVGP